MLYLQEAQLSLGKTERTAYRRKPSVQSRRESDFSEVTQFHARYVKQVSK